MVSRRTYYQNKRLTALRRLDRRTKNNEHLRVYRKTTYYDEKTKYQATIKKEKITIVERILHLDSRHKSMEHSLQASIKQNKEQPNLQNLTKT